MYFLQKTNKELSIKKVFNITVTAECGEVKGSTSGSRLGLLYLYHDVTT